MTDGLQRWRRPATAGLSLALGLVVAACGGGGTAKSPAASSAPVVNPTTQASTAPATFGKEPSTIATARIATVPIYQKPGDATPHLKLRSPNPDGVPRVFLVVGRQAGWLHVLLPVAPNGSEGWIAESSVNTTTTTYWLQVLRSEHRLRLYQASKKVLEVPAAIGKTDTPTPGGQYYLTELLKAPNPKGDYGPYAYGLSGYSTSLTQFNGHDPIIGIHGTNQAKLIGTSVSHGCVRVDNATITRLAKMLPLGTPVQITA